LGNTANLSGSSEMAERTNSQKRKILRRALDAQGDPDAETALTKDGIVVGEEIEMPGPEFLALLDENDDEGPDSITVTVYRDETPIGDREDIEGPLLEFVESEGLGKWTGSGGGNIGGRRFCDVTLAVHDLGVALSKLRTELLRLGAGPATELDCSDGTASKLIQ
jgi:hypothetical protein